MSQNGLKLNHEKTEWIIFNDYDYDYDYEIDLFGHIILRKYITIKCIIYKI